MTESFECHNCNFIAKKKEMIHRFEKGKKHFNVIAECFHCELCNEVFVVGEIADRFIDFHKENIKQNKSKK